MLDNTIVAKLDKALKDNNLSMMDFAQSILNKDNEHILIPSLLRALFASLLVFSASMSTTTSRSRSFISSTVLIIILAFTIPSFSPLVMMEKQNDEFQQFRFIGKELNEFVQLINTWVIQWSAAQLGLSNTEFVPYLSLLWLAAMATVKHGLGIPIVSWFMYMLSYLVLVPFWCNELKNDHPIHVVLAYVAIVFFAYSGPVSSRSSSLFVTFEYIFSLIRVLLLKQQLTQIIIPPSVESCICAACTVIFYQLISGILFSMIARAIHVSAHIYAFLWSFRLFLLAFSKRLPRLRRPSPLSNKALSWSTILNFRDVENLDEYKAKNLVIIVFSVYAILMIVRVIFSKRMFKTLDMGYQPRSMIREGVLAFSCGGIFAGFFAIIAYLNRENPFVELSNPRLHTCILMVILFALELILWDFSLMYLPGSLLKRSVAYAELDSETIPTYYYYPSSISTQQDDYNYSSPATVDVVGAATTITSISNRKKNIFSSNRSSVEEIGNSDKNQTNSSSSNVVMKMSEADSLLRELGKIRKMLQHYKQEKFRRSSLLAGVSSPGQEDQKEKVKTEVETLNKLIQDAEEKERKTRLAWEQVRARSSATAVTSTTP